MEGKMYIHFEQAKSEGKTNIYDCINNNGVQVGQIKWFGAWRKYCFYSINGIYDNNCLLEIITFLDNINKEWRYGRKKNIR